VYPIKESGSTIIFVTQEKTSNKPKLGRPKLPKGEAKSKFVRVRVTPPELKAIERAANGAGVSEWARGILLKAV
jgi:hypothetical protein